MYCTGCGKEIPDDSRFCPNCGKSSVQGKSNANGRTSELIRKAKGEDQSAISILYEQTYNQVYYTVKSMIKDEDAVFDILQDSYIKAFSHLDSFEGGDSFTAWVRQIAANTARDWMKKKRPMLFSELEQCSDMDLPAEEWFEDENTDHLPEYVIDQNETSRLIREILDELPEDQRAAIGMYYYEEMSVKEIAASMNATENAVKSRLLYGRRKIEKKVRELEKKGTKLYGLAPIPFLLWLLGGQKAYAAELPDAGILQNILESMPKSSGTVSGGAAHTARSSAVHAAKTAGTAKTAATASTGLSAAKITVAIIASVVIICGSVFGISKISKKHRQSQPTSPPVVGESSLVQEPTLEAEHAGEQDAAALWIEAEEAAGRTVLIGTVDTINHDEALELGGYVEHTDPDLNTIWVIIRLDSPQMLKGTITDRENVTTWESECSAVQTWLRRPNFELGEDVLNDYTGKHVICSASSFSMASHTSLPIGVPQAHDIHVFGTVEIQSQAPETTVEETITEPTTEPLTEISDDPLEEALEEYRNILANAGTYDFGEYAYPNGQYLYALEYMHTGDPVPTLLLCQLGDDYIDHVRVFYYDVDSKTVLAPEEVITTGVAQAGGYRGGLSMMGDGNGLQIFEAGGMRGDIYISRAIRSENKLTITQEWSGFLDDNDQYRDSAREITWYGLSDEAGFRKPDKNTKTTDIATDSAPTEQDATALWISAEEDRKSVV